MISSISISVSISISISITISISISISISINSSESKSNMLHVRRYPLAPPPQVSTVILKVNNHLFSIHIYETVRRAFESLDFSRTHQVALSSSRAALALIRLGP